jgi:hypothetical protein
MYGTFACKTYRSWLEGGEASDPDWACPEGCTLEYAEQLPPIHWELPPCPHCAGPSVLIEVLEPVAG